MIYYHFSLKTIAIKGEQQQRHQPETEKEEEEVEKKLRAVAIYRSVA